MWQNDIKRGFGLAIKRWRRETGISQEELAWRAGLHRSYVADIERGARNASLQTIEKLARALRLSLPALFQPLDVPSETGASVTRVQTCDRPVDILLVEDNRKERELALEALSQARLNNRTQVAIDGPEALDFVFCRGRYSRREPDGLPKLILLALQLSKMSGVEVLRTIKADPAARKIQVVVLTAPPDRNHLAKAIDLGAEAHIRKPLDFPKLSLVTAKLNCSWTLFRSARD
jgi:CheY-like chemotaxis protein/DNA-binding XRE family transcriptional regulator